MVAVCILFTIILSVSTFCVYSIWELGFVTSHKEEMILQLLVAVVRNSVVMMNASNFYTYMIFGAKFRRNFRELIFKKETNATNSNHQTPARTKAAFKTSANL